LRLDDGGIYLADQKDNVVLGLIGFGVVMVILGLFIQGYLENGAQFWLSNDLYVAGAILVIMGFATAMLLKD
jgi:hypothetical protein